MKKHVGLFLCSMVISVSHAQERIISETSVENRARFSRELPKNPEKVEAEAFAMKYKIPVREIDSNGRIREIARIVDNRHPLYRITDNMDASKTVSTNKIWNGAINGWDLRGKQILVAVWDGGKIRTTHVEFGSRVYSLDSGFEVVGHATHVAGTIGASGLKPDAIGMANQCHIEGYDWDNDNSEMRKAGKDGLLLSNHSYGLIQGFHYNDSETRWEWYGDISVAEEEDHLFGFYGTDARVWDDIAYDHTQYLIVKSAGNDRLEGPGAGAEHFVWDNGWKSSNKVRSKDGGPDGFDCIGTQATAKNILTVGAVHDIENGYNSPEDVTITSFSTFGPTDDGRIKPDIVGNGSGVYSPYYRNDQDYNTLSGTSMAAPNVSGSLVLLQELHHKLFGGFMKSSSLKALVIHTADDAGNTGPDYKFGWGLLNTYTASKKMAGDELLLMEDSISDQQVNRYGFYANGDTTVRITTCWTDPKGPVLPNSLDPEDLILVNDLDIRLTRSSDSTVYEPYILLPGTPEAPAQTGDNFRDNVEQIHLAVPEGGYYELVISHKGDITNDVQCFSMVVEGMRQVYVTQDSTHMDDINGFLQVTNAQEYPLEKRFVWLIEPVNQQSVNLHFTEFSTYIGDTVFIHDGRDANSPLLASFSGTLTDPDTLISSAGKSLFIEFKTGTTGGYEGFSSRYCTVPPEEEVEIMGETAPCNNSIEIYQFHPLPQSSYLWNLSDNIKDSATTQDHKVMLRVPGDPFELSVTPQNRCGAGQTSQRTIDPLHAPPFIQPVISGDTLPCTNAENLFSVEKDPNASYRWVLPEGWRGRSDSSSIQVTPEKAAGTIKVYPGNSCGESEGIALVVNPASLPRSPVIEGERISPCQNTIQEFFILAENEVDYLWDVEPGWEIMGPDSLSTVSVMVGSGSNGRMYLSSSNKCGDTLTSRNFLLSPSPEPPLLLTQPSAIDGLDEIVVRNFSDYFQVSWFRNDSILPDYHGEFLVLQRNGIYGVVATNDEGCTVASEDTEMITVDDVSLSYQISTGSGGLVRIENDTSEPALIRAYDLAGKSAYSGELQPGSNQFHTSRRGLLILRIEGSQHVKTQLVFLH